MRSRRGVTGSAPRWSSKVERPRIRRTRALVAWLLLEALLGYSFGCSGRSGSAEPAPPRPWSDAWIATHSAAYLDRVAARREALEASLVDHDNLYSRVRLAAYGRMESGWDALPEWNPRVRQLTDELWARVRREGPLPRSELTRVWDGTRPDSHSAWLALGERVFFELPLRSEPYWQIVLDHPELADSMGFETGGDGRFVGLVWLHDTDGVQRVGITCALCHSSRDEQGRVVAGSGRRTLDYGRVRLAYLESVGAPIEDEARRRWSSWGPGRADVLEEGAEMPIAIPDLWGLRQLRWLTQSATLRHDSPLALAIRQETQYIQANHLGTRPPRILMWALTLYLYSLTPPPIHATPEPEGARLFERHCGECHSDAVRSGEPVAVLRVGTDPELGLGTARGTGAYRPSPLIRVDDSAPYLHHGAIASLEMLLDPERDSGGHYYGRDLDSTARQALIRYLRTLD